MISPPAVLNGYAPPRFRSVPAAWSREAAQEAIELAASAGLVLDPWQEEVLRGALGELADGRWAAPVVGLVVPRQNGKGGILEARELAGLFLFNEPLITHTAHRFDTCLEHFRRVQALVDGTPDLSRKVKHIRESHGQESIELRSGQRLLFKARSKGAARGFSGDCIVFDEAFYLGDVGSAIPSLSAAPNPQLWYTSSAPLAREESDVLRRLVKRGRRAAAA